MRRIFLPCTIALLTLAPLAISSPVEGPSWSKKQVPAGTLDGGGVVEPGTLAFTKQFVAGQRACVVVIGDHKPVVDIEVLVYDSKKNLVAQDRGSKSAPDYAAVIWYPPRQETYRIVIRSFGKEYNDCSVAIK